MRAVDVGYERLKSVIYIYCSIEAFLLQCLQDNILVNNILRDAEGLVPNLKRQHQQLLEQLEQEGQEIAQLEESDPDYLEELKATISEQK